MKVNLLLSLFFVIFYLSSQNKDFQNWHNFELVYQIDKKNDILLDNGFRFTEHFSYFSKCFSDVSFKRNVSKKINYGLGFRLLFDKKNNVFKQKERYYLDFFYKDGFSKKLKYSLRTRLQTQFDSSFNFDKDVKSKIRQKVKFIYIFKSIDLNIVSSIESFYLINDNLDKIRFQIGFLKDLTQNTSLSINYLFENKYDDNISLYALRTKLAYKF